MNGKAIEAGNAVVRFSLSSGDVANGLKKLKANFNEIGTKLREVGKIGVAIGGTITGAFAGAVSLFASAGSQINDMSERTGIGTTALQELGYAAEQSGGSLEDIEKAALKMKKKGLNPADFDKVADSIAGIEDPVKRSQAAYEAFGTKAGAKLEPMLANLAELRREHQQLNIGIDPGDVKSADDMGDAFDAVKKQLRAIVIQIGAAVAGPLTAFFDKMKPILAGIIQWVKDNRSLIRTIAIVGAAVLGAGAALVGIGTAFTFIGSAIGGLVSAIGLIGSVIGGIVSIGTTLVGAVVSPLGLITAALGAGVFLWAKYTESGKATVGALGKLFGDLKETFLSAFGGIKDALASGDLATAGKIGLTALQIAWLEVWGTISDLIGGAVGDFVGDIAGKIGSGDLKGAWDDLVLGMSALWDKFVAGFMSAFGGAAKWIIDKWQKMVTVISQQILSLAKRFPTIGKAVLGVDINEEQKRAEGLQKGQIEAGKRRLAMLKELQAAGKEGGGEGLKAAMEKAGFDTSDITDWQAAMETINTDVGDLQNNLAMLGSTPVDILGDMQADAATQLQGTSDAMKKWIDDAPNRAAQSGDKFFDSIAGGADRLTASLETAKQQLEDLRKQAADNAANTAKTNADAAKQGVSTAAKSSTSLGTFNATNLLALQGTNGPAEETAKNTGKMVKLLQQQNDEGDTFDP